MSSGAYARQRTFFFGGGGGAGILHIAIQGKGAF